MLYYLEKFCRICIQTGGKLTDIESKDNDSIRFSDKLKACTQMVITRESLSTQICSSCVQKLRISYQFQSMCRKSTVILQQYLTELLSMSDGITTEKFLNSELTISTAALPKPRRKRVGKDERCSLLKKLLSRITQEQIVHNIHINGLAKLCERIPSVPIGANDKQESIKSSSLRNLLNFTKDFDFGYEIGASHNSIDLTPLERLTHFTQSFFYDHFSDYREAVIQGFDFDTSDEEDMFDNCVEDETEFKCIKEEIVIVEPDMIVKKEDLYDEAEYDYNFTSRFVQACYDSDDECNKYEKVKHEEGDKGPDHLAEIFPIISTNLSPFSTPDNSSLLKQMQDLPDCFKKHRTLSPYSVKCRTRGNPFINPQLKKQFQMRNFKCSTCNRRFKSPGYLKAHCSKLKH